MMTTETKAVSFLKQELSGSTSNRYFFSERIIRVLQLDILLFY
jgi:hypothetical protein